MVLQNQLATSPRLPEGVGTHASPPAFVSTRSGLFTGLRVLSWLLILSSCLGFALNGVSPETKLPPPQAITHQTALSKASAPRSLSPDKIILRNAVTIKPSDA